MCSAKKIFIICLCVVSSFVLALHSSASYAADISQSVSFINSGTGVMYVNADNNAYLNCYNACYISQNTDSTNTVGLRYIYSSIPNGTYYSDNIWQLDFVLWKVNASQSLHAVVNSIYVNSNHYRLVSVDYDMFDTNTAVIHVYIKMNDTFTASGSSLEIKSNQPGSTFIVMLDPSERISYSGWSLWKIESVNYDNSDIVSAIQSQPNYTNNLNTINNNINSVNSNLNQVNNSINQSNQDANDRYEDEKDTINDNGDNANSSWTDNADNLKFQPPTFLFNWFWSLGTTDQCIDISTLASLIHSNETQYCSWYPNNIRSIISPIINIFLVCFISGFIIKWLKKDGI